MDEHKKFKGPRKPAPIDGIVSDGRRLGVPVHNSYQPNQGRATPTLNNIMKRTDGFHPMRSSSQTLGAPTPETDEAALLDEPIVLDVPGDSGGSKGKNHHLGLRRPKLRRVIKRTALTLAVIFLVGVGYFGYKLYQTKGQVLAGGGRAPAVCNGDVPLNQLKTEGDSRVNVLLLGIGGEGHAGPNLTDTLIIASMDPVNDKIDLLSIPRDLWVRISGDGTHKINQAYADAKENSRAKDAVGQERDGVEAVDKTLEEVLGIPIHYHAVISFDAFKDTVDALGGVDMNVTSENSVYERLWVEGTSQHITLNVQPGQQHFNGQRALYYARSRFTSVRGDFDRSQRQRALMVAIKDKALSLGTFSNPVKVSELLDSLGKNVYTDFDTGSIKCLHQQISQIPSANIKSLDLVTPPNNLLATATEYEYGRAISVVEPVAGTFAYEPLQNFVRSSLRDSFLAKENAKVAIYNATNTEGLATSKATVMKAYGYKVTTVDNAKTATNPATTTVVDLSKGKHKYTKNYLQNRFEAKALTKLPADAGVTPPVGTDFVIILGRDVK